MKSKRYYNVDFLRLLFSLIIIYFHILHSNIMGFVGENEMYANLQKRSDNAMFIVEMFFIIAGFFFYYSLGKETDWIGFVLSKIFRLWPVLMCSIFIGGILNSFSNNDILNAFFLQCMGISLNYMGINWYISSYFWSMLFLYGIVKHVSKKYVSFVIGILVYFSYVININYTNGGFGRETVDGFLSLGLLRGIAGIGLGYLIANAYESIKKSEYVKVFKIKNKIVEFVLFTIVEVLSMGHILYFTVIQNFSYGNKFIFVIMFTILFICFILKRGLISRICDQKIFGVFGRYTFSIYAMQQVCFTVMQRTLWKNEALVNHVAVCITVSVVLSALVGIFVYYCVERPCIRFYKKKLM